MASGQGTSSFILNCFTYRSELLPQDIKRIFGEVSNIQYKIQNYCLTGLTLGLQPTAIPSGLETGGGAEPEQCHDW
jgi:hypothetical protein